MLSMLSKLIACFRVCDKVMFRGTFYVHEDGFGSSGTVADRVCPALLYVQKEGRV